MVPAFICEDCEEIGLQAEFLVPRNYRGLDTVACPPRCPRCKSTNESTNVTPGEVTEPEQFEGAKRLIKSAHEHTERDGIQREVTVVATKF